MENLHLTRVENQGINCSVLLVNRSPLVEAHLDHSIVNKSFDDFTSESTDLVLGVEHPDLSSDPATCQDVGLLVVQGEGGPGKRVEVLLDVLVLVLHEHGPRVDVDDAYAVATAGGHVGGGLVVVLRVGLEDNLPEWTIIGIRGDQLKSTDLPNLSLDIGRVVVLGMRPVMCVIRKILTAFNKHL